MKLKLYEIRDWYENLESVLELESEFDFSYGIAKNRKILKSFIDHLDEKFKPSKDYSEYENERLNLAIEMSEKDENGQPKIVNNAYVIKKDLRDNFKTALQELRVQYSKTIEDNKNMLLKLEETLMEDKEVDVHFIKKEVLPKLTPKQMESIIPILEI